MVQICNWVELCADQESGIKVNSAVKGLSGTDAVFFSSNIILSHKKVRIKLIETHLEEF